MTTPAAYPCTTCDGDYEGPATYPLDECSSIAGTTTPATISFGFVFTSATAWEVYSGDGAGVYSLVGTATFDGASSYLLSRTDEVDVPALGDVGDLTTSLTFTP